jgi:hypothetical protein
MIIAEFTAARTETGKQGGGRMNHRRHYRRRGRVAIILSLFTFSLITACVSDQPKPLPQPSPDQVRGHADRAFDKLKQEERERATQPAMPR